MAQTHRIAYDEPIELNTIEKARAKIKEHKLVAILFNEKYPSPGTVEYKFNWCRQIYEKKFDVHCYKCVTSSVEPVFMTAFNIKEIPAFIFFRDDKEVGRFEDADEPCSNAPEDIEDDKNQRNFRKDRLISLIQCHAPELVSIQEPLSQQVIVLKEALIVFDEYSVGRDDGDDDQGGFNNKMLSSVLLILFISIAPSFENDTVVFKKGEGGYFCFRIPSILTTSKGTLIAFTEARIFGCADGTQIDIAYKRSLDNGKTWSDLKVACRGNETNDGYTRAGNPAPVQLKYNQRILLPFCKNNIIPMQTYSDDDGVTFSPPQTIYNITKSDWKWLALGPPGGLLLQSNRIIIPGDFSTADGHLSSSFVMYNDFNGQVDKWVLGGNFSLGNYHPNECQAVELLPNANSIFINARSDLTVRIGAYSDDGGITFNKVIALNTLIQPVSGCEGSTLYHQDTHQLFYSGVTDTSIRYNLSLHISNDNGENWRFIKTIWPGPSAYSSLTTLNDQSVGVLYEAGTATPYETLTFTIIYNQTEKKFI